MPSDNNVPWEGQYTSITHEFAKQCYELKNSNPYANYIALDAIMTSLATELWDYCFSRTEIDMAFRLAVERLSTYCAGNEQRPGCP